MPPAKKLEQGKLLTYEDMLGLFNDFKDEVKRFKVQTGELGTVRGEIGKINDALRGSNGDMGLIGRFGFFEKQLSVLLDQRLPEILEAVNAANERAEAAERGLDQCRSHHDLEALRLENEIKQLRLDYQAHETRQKEAQEKEEKSEEKDSARFGGAEWWRQNAASILISVITALCTGGALIILQRIVK